MNQVYNCVITHLEIVGRLIKVWVQHNSKMSQDITTTLLNLKDKLIYCEPVQSLEQLNRSSVYIAKNNDGNYFRCNVVGISNTSPKVVNVYFIDYGSVHAVAFNDLITLNSEYCTQYPILKCPGQASEYYLSSVAVKPRAISDHELDWLKSLTLDCELPCSMYEGTYNVRMISIMLDRNIELSHLLVQKNLAQMVSRDDICEMGKDYMNMNYSSSGPYSGMNPNTNPNISKYQPGQTNSKIEIVSAQSSNVRKPSMPIYQPPPVYQQQVSSTFQQRYIVPKDKLVNLMSYPPPTTKKHEYTITVGSAYQMYVSHVKDGPLQFSLQLKQYADEVLPYLSLKLNSTPLQKFTSALSIGMYVIGMHPPDKTLRRAMVINAGSNTCTVYYVDLGSSETLPHSNIFQLPPNLSIPQIPEVAINFALKGIDSSPITDVLKSGFRELVMSKVVLAKVMTEGPVRTCELFVDGRDVKTLMTSFNQPPQYIRQLPPRKDVSVLVSYVESPQQIFVQYKSELPALSAIVDSLKSVWSLQKEILNINSLTIGKPVLSLYSSDNQWYRAQVMEIAKDQTVTVLYVDYGNKEIMTAATLREMLPDLVSKWRCQAVECCLEGFEYILPSELLATKLEEKILSEEVTLKMRSLLSADRLLVDLIDSSGNSIAAYLKEIHNNHVAESQKSAPVADSSSFREPVVERNVEIDCIEDEPKPVRAKQEDSFKKPKSRDSDEDTSTKWKSKDTQEDVSSSSGKWKAKDSHDDRWNSKDSHDDRRKPKDSYDDRRKPKDSHDDRWKSKDSYDDRRKPKDSHDDRWKSKDSYDDRRKPKDSHDDRWKPKDSYDDKRKSKDYHDDFKESYDDKRKSKDFYDDKWKSKDDKFRGGGDGDFYKRNDKWNDNKSKGKDDKWKSGGGKSDWDDSRGSKYNKEERFTVGPKKNDWSRKDGGSASGGGKKWDDDNRKGRGEFKWKDTKNFNEYDSKDTSKTLYSDGATIDKSTTRDDYASTSDVKFNPKVKEYIGWDLGGKTTLTVSLSHIETPERFYVKTPEADAELERLRDLIDSDENAMSRILPPRAVNVGTPVLAVFSEDEQLYRAIIDKVNNKTVNVLFVDYGNSSEVPSTELYYPSDNLARLPMAVICCCLNNVKPSGGPWTTDNDELVKCFGGYSELTMTIENVKLVDGMAVHNVNLTVLESGKDVAQILINAGLAKSASGRTSISTLQTQESIEPASTLPLALAEDSPCEEVWIERLELLVGQFLLAKVVSVVSSEAILVKLDATNLIVIGFSPDINTSVLQIGDNVIIHVHCVLEDRLRVTVYDKVGFVAGDTKREPQVNAICPMPIVRSRFRVTIPHCEQSFIYTQKMSDADRIAEMLDTLFTFYEETKPTNKEFVVNSFCAVKSADDNWYRAKVIKRNGDLYTIRFIDYGNTEEIDSSHIRKLDSQFYFPELAFKAEFKLKWKIMDEDLDLMSYVEGKEFMASFVKIDAQNWHISLEDDNKKSLAEELVKQGKAEYYKTCSFHELNTVIGDNIVSGDKIPVTVTHVESPELFWIQMVKHIQTVESMQAKVQTFSEGKTDSDCGVFAAKYSADDLWYRALCIDPYDPAVVRFIDYGNTDTVSDKKELPHLMTKPRSGYAVKMCLCAVPKDGEWSQEALNMFEEFIDANEVIAEIVSVSYKIVADLTKDDKSISSMLIESGLAVYEDFTPSIIKDYLSLPQPQIQNINVYVCHTLSVNDFCVLDVNREPELEQFSKELNKIKSVTPIVKPKPGDLVLANYPDDGSWYRAKIIQTDPLTVLFTDFGNSSEVDEIGQLPTELIQTPPFAVHCSLSYDSDSDLALDKFLELSDGGKNIFSMTIVKPGDPNIVKLCLNDSNIIDLLPKIQNTSVNIDGKIGFVTHFNIFEDFYVQLQEDTRLDNVIDELTAVESFSDVDKTLSVGLLVAAEFPEDRTWYRAKVISLEPLTVLFYDYGNVSEVTKVKELPPDLKLIPALSYKCSLEKPSSISSWTDSMADSFQDLISQELPFTIKLIKEGSTNVIDLITENQSVCEFMCNDTSQEVTTATTEMESMTLCDDNISDKIITLSFVNSVDDFYVNLEEDFNLKNLLTERLTHGNLFDDGNDVSVGDIIATPSPVLGDWLRAKVICNDPLTVYFIDEGSSSSEVHNIKILPQGLSIKDIKPLAYHCSLKKPDSITTWPDTLNDLEDMMTQSTDKFKIKVHSKGDPYDVSLFLDGIDVISKLGSNFINVSYTSVESPSLNISPTASTYNNKSVYICYGESIDNFYVQKEEDSDKLSEVTNSLSNSMTFSRVANLQIGSLVSAKCPADNLWYRGQVIATEPNTQVLFVDYGNCSNALMVRELPEKMKNIPPLVLHCSLKLPNNIKNWTEEAKEKFIEIISSDSESIYTIKIEGTQDPAIVSLIKDGKDLANNILGITEISNSDPNDSGTFTMNNKIAILSQVNKLDEFYVQLFDDADKINNVIEKLLEGDSFEKITNGEEDQLVAAQFVDMQWHRAIILKKEVEGYNVFFIDYGNKFTVSNISELPGDLKILPPLAYKLRLKKPEGIPEWTEEMEKQFALFKELNTQPLVILTHPTGCVSLMVNDISIYNKFTTLSLDNTHSTFVYVSYCESPSKFYVQFTSTIESQKAIIETLEKADDFNDTKDLKVGDLVCAKFPEDGLWYRSKILELNPEISVMFIDFGSSSVVVETKKLPAEMKDIEPLAKQCCLVPPQTETGWSAEASSYFLAMSSSPFTMKIIEENECSTVDLFIDGNSVTQDLLELCPMSVKIPESMFPSEDFDIDDEDVLMEEALFLAEEERRSRNKNKYNKILCNGISDLNLEEEECPAKNIILNTNQVNRKPSDVVIEKDNKEVNRAEQAPSEEKKDTPEVIPESKVNEEQHNVKFQEMETEVNVEVKSLAEETKEQETEIKDFTDETKEELEDTIIKTEEEAKDANKPQEAIIDDIKPEEVIKDGKQEKEIIDNKPEEEIKDAHKPEEEVKDDNKLEKKKKNNNKREENIENRNIDVTIDENKESSNVAGEDIKEKIPMDDVEAQIKIGINKTENEEQSNDEKTTDNDKKVPSDCPDMKNTPIKDESETTNSIVPKQEDEAAPCQNKVENKTDTDGTLKQENPSDSSKAKETGASNDSKVEPSVEK